MQCKHGAILTQCYKSEQMKIEENSKQNKIISYETTEVHDLAI